MYLTTCLLSITIYIFSRTTQNVHDDLQFDHNNLLNVLNDLLFVHDDLSFVQNDMPFEDNEQKNKPIRQIRRSILICYHKLVIQTGVSSLRPAFNQFTKTEYMYY